MKKLLYFYLLCFLVFYPCQPVYAAEIDGTPDAAAVAEPNSELDLYSLSSEVYNGSPYNSTIYTIWKGLCDNHEGMDFVAYRSNQNIYTIIFSDDISYTGGTFSGSGTYFRIDTSSNMGSSSYAMEKGTDSFVITANDNIVFTNTSEDYPSIDGLKENVYGQITTIAIIALLCFATLRWIFLGK